MGDAATLTTTTMPSPLGPLQLFAAGDQLVGLYMSEPRAIPAIDERLRVAGGGDPADSAGGSPQRGESAPREIERRSEVLVHTIAQLTEYFAGARQVFDLPLALRGTEFQQRVWQTLLDIPHGATWSYGELARAIGKPSASRAVGAANGKNPISIIVPCHRVIGTNGDLTGYGGGMPAKRWLLGHERAPVMRNATLALPL
jgi:methylated-DNA-[protein]-cysteine S-methyltransferase